MKVEPNSIAPELWIAEDASGCTVALVCGRRFGYTAAPLGTKREIPEGINPDSFTLAAAICHPVLIEIMPCPCTIHFAKKLSEDYHWNRVQTSFAGLSIQAARAALAEAYRGLKYSRLDHQAMSLETKTAVDEFIAYKGGTPWRNVNICLQWGRWEKGAVPMEERIRQLRLMGFDCTPKALVRYAEDHGL